MSYYYAPIPDQFIRDSDLCPLAILIETLKAVGGYP